MKTFVIGHRQPDLDSVVAAVSFAELAKARGFQDVFPLHCDRINHETKMIFTRFKVAFPEKISSKSIGNNDHVVLVDHNEVSQRAPEIKEEQITEIIDHHKASLSLNRPIRVDIHPWGSTSTIIYNYFRQDDLQPTTPIAKLLLSAILSDTLGLKSPTTTEIDRKAVKELVKLTNLDLEELILALLKAKSKTDHLAPEEVVTKDYKVYEFGGKKVFINQVETIEQDKVLLKKEGLVKALQSLKKQQGLDHAFCVLTDTLKENSRLIYSSEEDRKVAEKAFGQKGSGQIMDIGPKLSRKKQIAPEIERVLSK